MSEAHAAYIRKQLDHTRRELLDLGLRNPLLNYRANTKKTGKLSPRRIPIFGTPPEALYSFLVQSVNYTVFLPQQGDESQTQEDSLYLEKPPLDSGETYLNPFVSELIKPVGKKVVKSEWELQTGLSSQNLEKELLEMFRTARTSREEQGTSNLYIAMGMLEWYEADSSDEPHLAPLLLLPVELERANVESKFRLRYGGEDLSHNPSLEAKLKEFGLSLPALPESEVPDVQAYFASVKETVKAERRWQVRSEDIHLAFFSFSKLLMYRDLDPSTWPSGHALEANSLISALYGEGFRQEPSVLDENTSLDKQLQPSDLHHVYEADSSQTVVIRETREGHSLVVEGPPGTGKSQTITNMIAEAVFMGKTVLFVSEKRAALEVVAKRLKEAGLDEAFLELHSQKVQKKTVLAALKKTFDRSTERSSTPIFPLEELTELRNQLNAYAEAVNCPSTRGTVPHDAFGERYTLSERLQGQRLAFSESVNSYLSEWTFSDLARKQKAASHLAEWFKTHGSPQENPFWGSGKKTYTSLEESTFRDLLHTALQALQSLREVAHTLSVELQLLRLSPHTLAQAETLVSIATRRLNAPILEGIAVTSSVWTRPYTKELDILLTALQESKALHQKYAESLKPEAWGQEIRPERDLLELYKGKFWRAFLGNYRQARAKVYALYQGKPERNLNRQLEMLSALLRYQQLKPVIESKRELGLEAFRNHWVGLDSNWVVLQPLTLWLREFHVDLEQSNLPREALALLERDIPSALPTQLSQMEPVLSKFQHSLKRLSSELEWGRAALGTHLSLSEWTFELLEAQLTLCLSRISALAEIADFNRICDHLDEEGLTSLVLGVLEKPEVAPQLADQLRLAWLEQDLKRVLDERPLLRDFTAQTHNQRIQRFRELDGLSYKFNQQQIARQHIQSLAKLKGSARASEISVLKRQFELKTRHMAIRKLMVQAGSVIQTLKPVLMMSPLSVASFLPPGELEFDLVIFDEASQVRPADALGAIARAKQVIVVGDSQQLPPTDFFQRSIEGNGDEDDNLENSTTAGIQSVLGLFKSKNAPERMLRWHYRSRHESLIEVSNRLFYQNKLVVFPSPGGTSERLGVYFRHLPETQYDRGGSRTNQKEAQTVARAVFDFIRAQPNGSLGVVAFSMAQQRAIEDQLEQLRREHPEHETFFSKEGPDSFFVKNLENAQGDERDVIFVSVGYGRDEHGKLSSNFGPVNKQDGDKRLNVLFTRARMRCEVFCNFTAEALKTEADSPAGVRALKAYLHHAQTGRIDLPLETGREPDSPFELAVRDALIARGYEVKGQIGSAGFFIDLAVVDQKRPGRYILGIECDGATYHSARSARDRDRLRQRILEENFKWTLHRIWSTDFFRSPVQTIDKTVEAIERARLAMP